MNWFKNMGMKGMLICLIVTGGISAFVPLRELGARAHSRAWSRCRAYAYPCIVDTLPAGTMLLNDTGIQEANFMLAGSHLSNHVIADFDVPNPITQEFLLQRHVDYVVEVVPEQGGAGAPDTAEFLPATGASIESSIGRKQAACDQYSKSAPSASSSSSHTVS